jgi:hypothetical protein
VIKLEDWLKALPQTTHLWGFSPVKRPKFEFPAIYSLFFNLLEKKNFKFPALITIVKKLLLSRAAYFTVSPIQLYCQKAEFYDF